MSNINYLSINENFPVAGQDNDTQVFRDNFDTIKNSLRAAQEEITDLQNNSAPLNADANFRGNRIEQSILKNVTTQLVEKNTPEGETKIIEAIFVDGGYQTVNVTDNLTIEFTEFPGDNITTETPEGVGLIRLELVSSSGTHDVTFVSSAGTTFKKNSVTVKGSPTASSFTIEVGTDPMVFEVWRYELNKIYIKNLGTFE